VKLIDYLKVPYRLEAESVETEPGTWIARVAYPELPGCRIEAATIEAAIDQLELLRIRKIVELLQTGMLPRTPRPPLSTSQPLWLIEKFGLRNELAGLLDREELDLRVNSTPQKAAPADAGLARADGE
jgi:hypothetical protein